MSSSVWRGAFLLTMAAVAVKVMSAAYRIPFQNIAGDLGFYVYQQMYPFFATSAFLAAYGFPAAISKLVAARLAVGDRGGAAEIMTRAFYILSGFSIFMFLVLFLGAPSISRIMGDADLSNPLKLAAFSFILIPPIAAIRGFFQGYGIMKPTASSQIIEQFTRASLIIVLTSLVTIKGFGAYAAGMAAGAGSLVGMVASCSFLIILAARHRLLLRRRASTVALGSLVKALGMEGAAFSVSFLVLVLFLFIDTFTVLPLLGTHSAHPRHVMGVYDRGYPIVQLATAAATSFSLAFVPAMARAKAQSDQLFIVEKSNFAIRLCLAFGAAAAVGLALIAKSCNIMLFTDASGSGTLALFGVTILFGMMAMTAAGILQALGFTRMVLAFTIIGLGLKLGLNFCLIPVSGTFGAAASTVISFAVIAVLNGWWLHRQTGVFSFLIKDAGKLMIALLIMACVVTVWHLGMNFAFPESNKRSIAAIVALGGAGSGAAVYLISLLKFGYFSKEELSSLSKKEKPRQTA